MQCKKSKKENHGPFFKANGKWEYELIEDFTYRGVTVKKGEKTNGADIPRIFWAIQPPYAPSIIGAVVIHDKLCREKDYCKADKLFEELLKESPVPKWKRVVMVFVARWWNKIMH